MITFLYYLGMFFFNIDGVYGPTCTDFPMLDGKEDIRLDVAPLLFGARSTVSYGVTDNLFVQAEAFYVNMGKTNTFGQLTSGWYNNHDNKIVELFGGVSLGYGQNRHHDDEFNIYGNYGTCFLQGDYGWKDLANSHIDVALGAKLGYYYAPLSINEDHTKINRLFQAPYFEPTINFRFGWEKFKFNLKFGYNFHKEYTSARYYYSMCGYPRMELSLNYHFKSANRQQTE